MANAIVGQSYWTVLLGAAKTTLKVGYRRAMSEGISVMLDHHYWSDAHDIRLDVRACPTKEDLAVFHCAISARKRAEEELWQYIGLVRFISGTTYEIALMRDRENRMTNANPTLLSAFSQSWEMIAGRTDAKWASDPAKAAAILAADRRAMEGGYTEAVEEVFIELRGRCVFLSIMTLDYAACSRPV